MTHKNPQTRNNLENIIRSPEMAVLAQKFGVGINQIVGGYLRQPITGALNQEGIYITGECIFNNKRCGYQAPKTQSQDVCYSCKVYQMYLGND